MAAVKPTKANIDSNVIRHPSFSTYFPKGISMSSKGHSPSVEGPTVIPCDSTVTSISQQKK